MKVEQSGKSKTWKRQLTQTEHLVTSGGNEGLIMATKVNVNTSEEPKRGKASNTKERAQVVRLYRSETDRILGGVAGGLADFFDVDSTLVRIIFVLLTLFGGGGLLIYLLLWILVPTESRTDGVFTKDFMHENID